MNKDAKVTKFKLEGWEKEFQDLIAQFSKIPRLKVSASFDSRFKEQLGLKK